RLVLLRGPASLSRRRYRNPGAVAAAHQDAILGFAKVGDADREPDADRSQRHGERERSDIGEHAVTEVVGFIARPLVTRQIIRSVLASDRAGFFPPAGRLGRGARPELEYH